MVGYCDLMSHFSGIWKFKADSGRVSDESVKLINIILIFLNIHNLSTRFVVSCLEERERCI